MMIPCLCSFAALGTLAAEPSAKKRTRTLFHKELGSSTNCMVRLSEKREKEEEKKEVYRREKI